jgi:hypothetical protein
MEGCCEHGNESSASVKGEEIPGEHSWLPVSQKRIMLMGTELSEMWPGTDRGSPCLRLVRKDWITQELNVHQINHFTKESGMNMLSMVTNRTLQPPQSAGLIQPARRCNQWDRGDEKTAGRAFVKWRQSFKFSENTRSYMRRCCAERSVGKLSWGAASQWG